LLFGFERAKKLTHGRVNNLITAGAIATISKRIGKKRIWVLVDIRIKLTGKF
jgi:hypothetical protein